ncbi:MAG: BtrH N-terminal domain-containing protein [Chloroflexi bacterium]|nr:BtrH N-terminal domain-containing protein [Chloroflexota bacterium]
MAPHSGKPFSEAMLLGISGGIAFGYFLFHYVGFDPQLALLTRNTFDPLQTLLERLGVVQTVMQTASEEKAHRNLMDVLENEEPALVWADSFQLPYNGRSETSDSYWDMQPLVVYGHDGHEAYIADRSSQGLRVDADTFLRARGRIKKDKFRVITLDLPSTDKLSGAVSNGIW